jgi:NAD(P)-dependent dehydrogenase (short-subunit alcohol dehydrogenase family)
MFDLTGKVALVTGGNSGLGLAFARGLAKNGANIVIWGRSADKNAAAERELLGLGASVWAQMVDVADETQVIAGFAEAVAQAGRIDCVIQNAGFNNPATAFTGLTAEQWHAQIDVALHGGFYTLREAARHMVARSEAGDPGGSMMLCGSGTMFAGIKGLEHYAAAKGGLAAMMRCMATELAPHGIRVNMLALGYIKTDLVTAPGRAEALAARTPMGRVGSPEDVEGAAAYLASNAARFHTGDILNIDGGWLASYV